MSHIEERTLKDGSTSYKAEVVVRVEGKRVKKTATFDRHKTAAAWAAKIEKEIKAGDFSSIEKTKHQEAKTVADAINEYLSRTQEDLKSTKKQVLTAVASGRFNFSDVKLKDLKSSDIVSFARELTDGVKDVRAGVKPATVSSYLSHTTTVLQRAKDFFGDEFECSHGEILAGRRSCNVLKLSGKPETRERRPTLQELDTLMQYFKLRHENDRRTIPMHIIIAFAIFSCRRQSEIVKLLWKDYDDESSDILVRGMKHPTKPNGITLTASLTPEAVRLINVMYRRRKNGPRIFPYSADVISRSFTDACELLEIEDLHFHDLRHEGVSWLRETGMSVSQVMMISRHTSTQTLDRYTNMKSTVNKFADWKWLKIIEEES